MTVNELEWEKNRVAHIVSMMPDIFKSVMVGTRYYLFVKGDVIGGDAFFVKHYQHYQGTLAVTLRTVCDERRMVFMFSILVEDPDNPKVRGTFSMGGDFGIPDDLCVKLYDYHIGIQYSIGTGSKREKFKYDKVAIRRRHTLKNIING